MPSTAVASSQQLSARAIPPTNKKQATSHAARLDPFHKKKSSWSPTTLLASTFNKLTSAFPAAFARFQKSALQPRVIHVNGGAHASSHTHHPFRFPSNQSHPHPHHSSIQQPKSPSIHSSLHSNQSPVRASSASNSNCNFYNSTSGPTSFQSFPSAYFSPVPAGLVSPSGRRRSTVQPQHPSTSPIPGSPAPSSSSQRVSISSNASTQPTSHQPFDPTSFASNKILTSKYTFWNFLPFNLLEQFSKVANLFFLLIVVLQSIPSIRSTLPGFAAVPLIVIITVAAIKDGLEDRNRHIADNKVNKTKTHVYAPLGFLDRKKVSFLSKLRFWKRKKNPHPENVTKQAPGFITALWENIQVGDLILLHHNDHVPADILILATSEKSGVGYVETKHLDGETNLKLRRSTPGFHGLTALEVCQIPFSVVCEAPHPQLYAYKGSLDNGKETTSLNIEHLVLRGCSIKNTEWMIGVVLYTGADTKIMLNSGKTPIKHSRIDKELQPHIIMNFLVMIIMCTLCLLFNIYWAQRQPGIYGATSSAIVKMLSDAGWINPVFTFFAFLVVYQNIVPISLYVSIEFVKTVQAYFIYADDDFIYQGQACAPKRWNISDDLGQVKYIFSDKTGTLTKNVMTFKKCCIAGITYQTFDLPAFYILQSKHCRNKLVSNTPSFADPEMIRHLYETPPTMEFLDTAFHFWQLLATCHTVMANAKGDHTIEYQAQSPDEAALVNSAKDMGFIFLSRELTSLGLSVMNRDIKIELLHLIEFNSTRKRMSIVIRTPQDKILLYCKGADSVIFQRLREGQEALKEKILDELQAFAVDGLRTLCLAYRELNPEEYRVFARKYHKASIMVDGREQAMESVSDNFERGLILLGATAIEDQLQDGVPYSIERLSKAGMHIWMLTGDKTETAINVGYACNLLHQEMPIITIVSPADIMNQLLSIKDLGVSFSKTALVIEGEALKAALEECYDVLLDICLQCQHVVCCRVSPLQKAQVVAMVRQKTGAVTLAIGDGANDVSMIQCADLGIGIAGEEGVQAALASDYVIGQFRFLVKLLLVHGRWSHIRVSEMIFNFFYKSIVWVFVMFWYQYYSGFSAALLHDYTYLMLYNVFFTIFPVLVVGIFDQDVPLKYLLEFPQLYPQKHGRYNNFMFSLYVLDAIYQSIIAFFVPLYCLSEAPLHSKGYSVSTLEVSTTMAVLVVFTVNIYAFFSLHFINWISFLAIIFCACSIYFYIPIYSLFPTFMKSFAAVMYAQPYFYLIVLVCFILCVIPKFVIKYYYIRIRVPDDEIIREICKLHTSFREEPRPAEGTAHHGKRHSISLDPRKRQPTFNTGFAFAQTRGSSESVYSADSPLGPHFELQTMHTGAEHVRFAGMVDASTGAKTIHQFSDTEKMMPAQPEKSRAKSSPLS